MAGRYVGLLKLVAVIALVADLQRVLERCQEVRTGHGPGLHGVAVGRDSDDIAGSHIARRDAAADAARVFDGKVRARQVKIGAADHMSDGLGLGGVALLAGAEIGGAHHLPAVRARCVLAVEIIGRARAEHLARCGAKGIVERLDLVVVDLIKDALIGGALVGIGQKNVYILGGIELLVAFACVYCHRVIVGAFSALGVVLVGDGKQSHFGKGAARLDNVDCLAVGSRHLLVKVDVLVACDKGIDATEPRGKGLGVERVRDTNNNIAALLAQLLCLGIDGVCGTREVGARD